MSGVAIVVQLLLGNAALAQLVPAAQIVGDEITVGAPLPSISAQSVSSVARSPITPGASRHITERVQVTVHAASRPQATAIVKLLRRAGDGKMPVVADMSDIVVQLAGVGPDFTDAVSGARIQSQDFMVSFNEQT
jgi:hypothetical protein